ncbi:MAG: transcriptional repressor [Spirochaetae bacterium HGW-Spirochaetae-5]|nr:MAG: transcriptional repressor [Spirochaetae bacterium HGW-Spirochaetae-5]
MLGTDFFMELSNRGIQPSIQRAKILEFLWKERIHPTADDIFDHLHHEIPTLSRTTVYNTVKLFTEHNILQPLVIEDKEIRYDIDTSLHGHFKCESCGNIFDFKADNEGSAGIRELEGFQIRERHIYFKGLCSSCSNLK